MKAKIAHITSNGRPLCYFGGAYSCCEFRSIAEARRAKARLEQKPHRWRQYKVVPGACPLFEEGK
ncbi:MAG: hypothetical protein ACYTG0_12565 [Planctomycetota bacterium]